MYVGVLVIFHNCLDKKPVSNDFNTSIRVECDFKALFRETLDDALEI